MAKVLTKLHRQLWGDHCQTDCRICFDEWLTRRLAQMHNRLLLDGLQEADDGR